MIPWVNTMGFILEEGEFIQDWHDGIINLLSLDKTGEVLDMYLRSILCVASISNFTQPDMRTAQQSTFEMGVWIPLIVTRENTHLTYILTSNIRLNIFFSCWMTKRSCFFSWYILVYHQLPVLYWLRYSYVCEFLLSFSTKRSTNQNIFFKIISA